MEKIKFITPEEIAEYIKSNPHIDTLNLIDYPWLTSVPEPLPAGLKILSLMRSGVKHVKGPLPQLRILALTGSADLESVDEPLPESIEHLYFKECGKLRFVQNPLPKSAITIDYSSCGLSSVPPLAQFLQLQHLGLSWCSNMQGQPVPELPQSLEYIGLGGWTWLTSAPDPQQLPNLKFLVMPKTGIKHLAEQWSLSNVGMFSFNGCADLETLPKTPPPNLTYADFTGCNKVKIPDAWYQQKIKTLILPDGGTSHHL